MPDRLEEPAYRESRLLVPPPLGWLVVALSLAGLVTAIVNAEDQLDTLLRLPGLVGFVAVGLVAALARLDVDVYPDRLVVGNTARLSRSIPWPAVMGVEVRSSPPPRFAMSWPLARRRIYTLRREGGVELVLADGERVFLGSANPEALAAAIRRVAPHVAQAGDAS
jgi:hypothetical protein